MRLRLGALTVLLIRCFAILRGLLTDDSLEGLARRRKHPNYRSMSLLVLTVSMVGLVSCAQLLPLMGEGPPPGYVGGDIPDSYRGLANPYTLEDRRALEAGRLVYESECASCHGIKGRGDGPRASYLEPRPADFTAPPMRRAFAEHPDYLFWWVSEGVIQTPMPAFADRLSEAERWQAIVYSWYLAEQ